MFDFFQKGDFIGRTAHIKQMEKGVSRRFTRFALKDFNKDTSVWPWGGEPIYRNGHFCGTVGTTGYGFTASDMLCVGYVADSCRDNKPVFHKYMKSFIEDPSASYEIEVDDVRYKAHVLP